MLVARCASFLSAPQRLAPDSAARKLGRAWMGGPAMDRHTGPGKHDERLVLEVGRIARTFPAECPIGLAPPAADDGMAGRNGDDDWLVSGKHVNSLRVPG